MLVLGSAKFKKSVYESLLSALESYNLSKFFTSASEAGISLTLKKKEKWGELEMHQWWFYTMMTLIYS